MILHSTLRRKFCNRNRKKMTNKIRSGRRNFNKYKWKIWKVEEKLKNKSRLNIGHLLTMH